MIEHSEIAVQRLVNQQLVGSVCTSVAEVVHWMGAMQAQDYDMAKWAVGVRLPGSTESLIEDALDQGASFERTCSGRPGIWWPQRISTGFSI